MVITPKNKLVLSVVVVMILAGILGWRQANVERDEELAKPAWLTSSEGVTADEKFEAAAARCLRNFWSAKDWRLKLKYVRDPSRVSPLINDYYVKQGRKDPEEVSLRFKSLRTIGPVRLMHFGFSGKFPENKIHSMEAAVVCEPDGRFLLDWESYVGASEMQWSDFGRQRRTRSTLFRCYLKNIELYSPEFADHHHWASFRLSSPDGNNTFHGYCIRDSKIFVRLTALLQGRDGSPVALTLNLSFPEEAQSDNCVKIDSVVAESWLVLE